MNTDPQFNVLVVDDDDAVRSSVKEALELEGYTITTAKNGIDALAVARNGSPQVILLDMMMPEMNGKEFLEIWKLDPLLNQIPVIIFSVSPIDNKYGPLVKQLNKPVDLNLLLSTLSSSRP